MSALRVRPFEVDDVPAAGALLAARHRRHRTALPLLDVRYEDVDGATAEVAAALATEHASGAVAVREGEMVGFLLGAPKPSEVWGPNVWVEAAGQAAVEAETIRDLYAVAATRWVDEGRTAHYVLVPATEAELVGAWFRLGFGHQHTHGLRAVPVDAAAPAGRVTVRRATRDDIPVLARLDVELPLHQGRAPTFSAGSLPTIEQASADWEADIDRPEYAAFVAEVDGTVVGSAVATAVEQSGGHTGPARPDNAALLGFAAVFPEARGSGAGRALSAAVLEWAAASGYAGVVADWRETNLLASRAWPALGFVPSYLRLHRLLGY